MVVALAACGTDTDDSSATASGTDPNETQTPSGNAGDDTPGLIAGTFTGMNLAPGTKLAVLWLVSSSNPDYDYKLGEGAIDADGSYLITLPETLPVEAINDWGIGVGLPLVLAENATLPDGIVSGDDFERLVVGFFSSTLHYLARNECGCRSCALGRVFEEGYSCARCLEQDEGFDGYEPMDCADPIDFKGFDDDYDFCNWSK